MNLEKQDKSKFTKSDLHQRCWLKLRSIFSQKDLGLVTPVSATTTGALKTTSKVQFKKTAEAAINLIGFEIPIEIINKPKDSKLVLCACAAIEIPKNSEID